MPVVNLKKAKQTIYLSDDPDSPSYVLDLTNSGIGKKLHSIRVTYQRYLTLQEEIDELRESDGPETLLQLQDAMKEVYESIVTLTLGEDAWNGIIDYVTDGEELDASEVTMVLNPLIFYLLQQLNDVITANNAEAYKKYLNANASDAI